VRDDFKSQISHLKFEIFGVQKIVTLSNDNASKERYLFLFLGDRLMKGFVSVAFLLLCLISSNTAQSGRKAVAKPKPTPEIVSADDPSQYSESKPHPPRTYRPSERFPGIGDSKATQTSAPPVAGDTKDEGDVLRVETNLITIPVSVFDRNGLYIPNLRQQDFKIFEDGKEQEIAYFGTTDKPFTVALLLDTSPSTEYKIDEIHRAAEAFVNLLEPNLTAA
jgi:hypothetical protein